MKLKSGHGSKKLKSHHKSKRRHGRHGSGSGSGSGSSSSHASASHGSSSGAGSGSGSVDPNAPLTHDSLCTKYSRLWTDKDICEEVCWDHFDQIDDWVKGMSLQAGSCANITADMTNWQPEPIFLDDIDIAIFGKLGEKAKKGGKFKGHKKKHGHHFALNEEEEESGPGGDDATPGKFHVFAESAGEETCVNAAHDLYKIHGSEKTDLCLQPCVDKSTNGALFAEGEKVIQIFSCGKLDIKESPPCLQWHYEEELGFYSAKFYEPQHLTAEIKTKNDHCKDKDEE